MSLLRANILYPWLMQNFWEVGRLFPWLLWASFETDRLCSMAGPLPADLVDLENRASRKVDLDRAGGSHVS